MRLVRQVRMALGQAQQIPLSLPFPYEYTLAPEEFTLHDIRFKELPFSREFAPPERQHLIHTLGNFQQLLNTGQVPSQHIQKSLVKRVQEVRNILAQADIKLQFKLCSEALVKSQGYLEIKPVQGVSLQEADLKPIHHYRLERERQTLTVHLRPQKEKLSAEEQLKKDIADKMGESSKEVREKLDNMRFSKEALFMNRFINRLMSIGKSEKKKRFEPYFIIDQIEGEMECSMTHGGKHLGQWKVGFDSKWLYWVNNLESEDLKRHRKRTLFDFQYWNRGNFFPIRNYASEVADFE